MGSLSAVISSRQTKAEDAKAVHDRKTE
jgi:hypothetical protein